MNNIQTTEDELKKILEIPIANFNFANATKWIFNIPIGRLFQIENPDPNGQYLEYPLNCQSVTFPSFKIGTTKTSFMGYSFDISSRQNLTEKGISFQFLISNNWLQYLMLLKWFELEDYTMYNANRAETQTVQLGKVKPVIDDSQFRTPYESRTKSILFYTRSNGSL